MTVLPLRVGDRTLGAMAVCFPEREPFQDEERSFALRAADLCAQALDRAQGCEAETRARVAAEAANLAKDEFLSTLGHELRTPLTSILGWANILRTRHLPAASATRALATIERNARAQVQLVDDILDVSRIVIGKLRLTVTVVDPAAMVRAAIEVVRPAAEAKRILLDADIAPDIGTLVADPHRLQQIAGNLLTNAVKFSPAGSAVEIRLDLQGDSVRLQVVDRGEGIEAPFLPHVFERFRQADASKARVHGGLGLGLAIVKHLVELHHGTISAESAGPGRGSTFTVTLPCAWPDDDADGASLDADAGTPLPCGLDRIQVVLVDDEPDTRDLIATILTEHGAVVHAASSARDGRRLVELGRAHVLISDIGMPDEDGYALIQKVRALPGPERRVPALALTAFVGREVERRAVLAGFDAFLSKPVLPGRLVDTVARLATPLREP
jgi:signal transduction histidine kinase/CheY-like chemotaxis protein